MNLKTKLIALAAGAVFFGVSPAMASAVQQPITYDIGASVGTGFYSGWIETDGVTGPVGFSDIIGWDITINGGGPPSLELIGPQNTALNNGFAFQSLSGFTVIGNGLYFDFSAPGDNIVGFQGGIGVPIPGGGEYSINGFICFAGPQGCSDKNSTPSAIITSVTVSGFTGTDPTSTSPQSGNTLIGTAVTPIPAALPLFAGGLGALGLLGWRRKRNNAAEIVAA